MTDAAAEFRTPFVDDALLEQRQQQRQLLLSIPKDLADRVRQGDPAELPVINAPDSFAAPTLAQRLLVETHARDRIDDLLDELQVGMVGVIDLGVAQTIAGYLDAALAKGPNPGATGWRAALAEDLATDVEINESALGEMIDLMLMADSLADDGFSDLRFT